jgi:hypothetical protein
MQDELSVLWRSQMGKPTEDIDSDLAALERWFNPLISGAKVRTQLTALEPVTHHGDVTEPFILDLPRGRRLVTYEGRLLLDEIRTALLEDQRDPVILSATRFDDSMDLLIDRYRELVRRKLDSVTKYQDVDRAPALHPSGIGVLLFLLINRSTDRDRAIERVNDSQEFNALDDAVTSAIDRFVRVLNSDKAVKTNREQYSLYGGYAISEAARRLGSENLIVSKNPLLLYLTPNGEKAAIELVLHELRRRGTSRQAGLDAFDALLDGYDVARGSLARFKVGFERPADTAALRETIAEALSSEAVRE